MRDRTARTARSPHGAAALRLERLEDRLAPATHTWTGAASDLWSADANWIGGAPTGDPNADLVFPAVASHLTNTNDLSDLTVASITFQGDSYILSGQGITLTQGLTVNASGANGITVALNLQLGGAQTVTVNDGPTLFVSGTVSGPRDYSWTKEGTGVLELIGFNTYAGDTILNAGAIEVGGAIPFGSGHLMLNSGQIFTRSTPSNQVPNSFTVNGPVSFASDGEFILSGNGTLTAGTTLMVSGAGTTVFSGNLDGGGGLAVASAVVLTGTNTYAGGTSLAPGAQLDVVNGSALGSGAVDLNGAALETVAAATFANSFTVEGDSLIGSSNAVSFTGPGTLQAGATLTVENSEGVFTFSGPLGGAGSLSKDGLGTLALTGADTYAGGTTLVNGLLSVGTDTALGTGLLTINHGTLQASTSVSLANPFRVDGMGMIGGSSDLQIAGAGSLGFGAALAISPASPTVTTTLAGILRGSGDLQLGGGTLVLGAANSYSGQTVISGLASLRLGASNAVPSQSPVTLMSGSTLDLHGFSDMIGPLAGNGAVALGGGTLIFGAGDLTNTFAGRISGAGRLVKIGAGDLTLAGDNSYTGGTHVTQGRLLVTGATALGMGPLVFSGLFGAALTAGSPVTLANPFSVRGLASFVGPLTFTGAGTIAAGASLTASATFTGGISGGGELAVGGTVLLGGLNQYTGPTRVTNAGLLRITSTDAIPRTSSLLIQNATVDLNGFDDTVGSLAGDGNLLLHSQTLTVGADNTATTFSGQIIGTGSLVKTGMGALTLQGNDLYMGGTTLASGTLVVDNSFALGTGPLTLDAGTTLAGGGLLANPVVVTGPATVVGNFVLSGQVSLAMASVLAVGTPLGFINFTATLTGPGALLMVGQGTLGLFGASDYAGGTTLSAGTLLVGSDTALGNGPLALAGGTLQAGTAVTLPNPYAVSGPTTISGNSDLTLAGPGLLTTSTLTVSSVARTVLSLFTNGGGTLIVDTSLRIDRFLFRDGLLAGNGSVTLTDTTWTGGTMGGAGITLIPGRGSMDIAGTRAVYLVDSRILSDSGHISFPGVGGIWVSGMVMTMIQPMGSFDDQTDNRFVYNGGQPQLDNEGTFVKSGGSGTTTIDPGVAFTNGGTLQVQTGTLNIGGDLPNVGAVSVAAGTSLRVDGMYTQTAGTTLLAGGTLAAGGGVLLHGGILSGSGSVDADVVNAAEIDVATSDATGVLTINGSYTQTAAGILSLKLGGLGIDNPPNDQLAITGTATLDGTLNVTLLPDFMANAGDSYQVLTFGALNGTFATTNLPDLGNGLVLNPAYTSNSLNLVVTPT